jgi:peptidoglycan/LPS O-acetylase OafA/YrhL
MSGTAPLSGPRVGVSAQPTFRLEHRPALDGLRGFAILLVLLYDCLKLPHDGTVLTLLVRKVCSWGWIGVDLFFVLSGFLITSVLWETAGRSGYWRSFLLRRSLRIFPLYYGTLLGLFFVAPGVAQTWGLTAVEQAIAAADSTHSWYWWYGQNWLFAWQGVWPEERLINHFWSLAVEEQFYLVWPAVVLACRGRKLLWLCGVLIATAFLSRCFVLAGGGSVVATYVLTFCRMDSLCCGAALAAWFHLPGSDQTATTIDASAPRDSYSPSQWTSRLLLGSCLAVWLILIAIDFRWPILGSGTVAAATFGHTLIAVGFTVLLANLVQLPAPHRLVRLFSWTGLRTLGHYSYAIYVFHRFVYYGVIRLDWSGLPDAARGWVVFALTLLISLWVARISWLLLEGPALRLKRYVPRPTGAPTNTPLAVLGGSAVSPQ